MVARKTPPQRQMLRLGATTSRYRIDEWRKRPPDQKERTPVLLVGGSLFWRAKATCRPNEGPKDILGFTAIGLAAKS